MKHLKKYVHTILCTTLCITAACSGRRPIVSQQPPSRTARIEFARRDRNGTLRRLGENTCLSASVECAGAHDLGTQHMLAMPGRVCEPLHSDGRIWVHAQGVTEVPWPCAGAGEVWVSGLLPDVGCHHPHGHLATTVDRGDHITATVELECSPGPR